MPIKESTVSIILPEIIDGATLKMRGRLSLEISKHTNVKIYIPIVGNYFYHKKILKKRPLLLFKHILLALFRFYGRYRKNILQDANTYNANIIFFPTHIPVQKILPGPVLVFSPWTLCELRDKEFNRSLFYWIIADHVFSSTNQFKPSYFLKYRANTTLVASSKHIRNTHEDYGLEVSATIHGGINTNIFCPNKQQLAKDKFPTRILGYYQPQWWVKGSATLLQSIICIKNNHPNLSIDLVGHQSINLSDVRQYVDKVHFGLSPQQMAELYKDHQIFIYPSYSDGFQSPPLEAMACGCSIITTNIGAAPEYCVHLKNSILVDPLDHKAIVSAVNLLISEPSLRTEISRNAMNDASEWTIQKSAQEFSALLNHTTHHGAPH